MPQRAATEHAARVAVTAAVGFHAVATWAWLRANGLPDGFQNEFIHLQTAVELTFRARALDWSGLHFHLFEEYYPPLLGLSAALAMGAFGLDPDVAASVNLAALGVTAVAVYAVGHRLRGPFAGAAAAVACLFYPSVFGNARRLEPNVLLTATTALAAWALLGTRGFRQRGPSVLFGAAAGLALLADRLSAAVFLAAPVAAALWEGLRGAGGAPARRRALAHAGLAAAATVAIAGYYYWNFARLHLAEVTGQVVAGEVIETGVATERRALGDWTNWAYYGIAWVDSQMGLLLGVAAAAATAVGLARRGRPEDRLVLAWGVGSLVLLTLVHKKQPFYSIPALPAFAVLTGVALADVRQAGLRAGVCAALLVGALHQHAALTGLWPTPIPTDGPARSGIAWRWLAGTSPLPSFWADRELTQAAPARPAPVDPAAAARAALARGYDPTRDLVVVLSDSQDEPEVFFYPLARLAFGAERMEPVLLNPDAAREKGAAARFFLYLSGDPARPWPRDEDVAAAMDRWKGWRDDRALLDVLGELRTRAEPLPLEGAGGTAGATLFLWEIGAGG